SPDAQATVHETLLSRIPSVAAIPRDGVKEPYPVQWIRCRGEHRALARLGQRPELPPLPQDAGRLQLEAADLGQVPIELQDLPGLDHLEALADYRQGGFGVRAVQDLLLRKRVNRANAVLPSDEADLGLLDRPVHTGTSPPAIDRLIGRQPVAQ